MERKGTIRRSSPHFFACKAHLSGTYPSVREYCPAHLSGLGQPHGPEVAGLETRKKSHISPFIPFAPQVRPTGPCGSHHGCFMGVSVQHISFLTEIGTGICTEMQDSAQSQASATAPGLPDAKNWEEGDTRLCTSTALELGGPAPPSAGRHGKPWGQSWQLSQKRNRKEQHCRC